MGKNSIVIVLSALCVLSIAGLGQCDEPLVIKGKVFCDTCRVSFPTKVSTYIANAEVVINCTNIVKGVVTFTHKVKTGNNGAYKIKVPGDHEDEICMVAVVSSPDSNCNEIDRNLSTELFELDTKNNDKSFHYLVNLIGVRAKKVLDECKEIHQVLKELAGRGNEL